MDTWKINALRVASNQFYLNKYTDQPLISDSEYDSLVKEYEAEGGSVKELVEWEKGQRIENNLPIGLSKVQVWDNNLSNAVESQVDHDGLDDYYLNYKYDGGAILGKYRNGKLYQVVSTPDEAFGINRTQVFWDLFPHEIDNKDIIAIQAEALVDYRAYGQKARNKANGLLNSINMDEEARNELFIRAYKVYFKDGNYNYYSQIKALDSLPIIRRSRIRRDSSLRLREFDDEVFKVATRFDYKDAPTEALTDNGNDHFQVDGVVMYNKSGVKGFKFYYTESAITTVTKVVWTLQNNGGYSCKLWFDPVVLNDKNISQASSGGVPNLMWMKMGKGAKIRVILANMTIPKIIEVLDPSENYEWPKCECGYQMSEKDIYGSTLKCQSEVCSTKFNLWKDRIDDIPNGSIEAIIDNKFVIFDKLLNIDRWSSKNSYVHKIGSPEDLEFNKQLGFSIQIKNLTAFRELINKNFNMTSLCSQLFMINSGTAFSIILEKVNNINKNDD